MLSDSYTWGKGYSLESSDEDEDEEELLRPIIFSRRAKSTVVGKCTKSPTNTSKSKPNRVSLDGFQVANRDLSDDDEEEFVFTMRDDPHWKESRDLHWKESRDLETSSSSSDQEYEFTMRDA